MKKALMLASVASMIDQFNMPNIELLQSLGYKVHVACNFNKGSTCTPEKIAALKEKLTAMGVEYTQIDFSRNITDIKTLWRSYRQSRSLIESDPFDLIHCHSPVGGAICRLAARKARKKFGTKVIYTAHGFHFYKGAPKKNWLVYYPVERLCSRWTDLLITINKEDAELAERKMKAKKTVRIPGVGINAARFSECSADRAEKRKEFGIPNDAILIASVGELNQNKNHRVIVEAIKDMNNVHYAIAGQGAEKDSLIALAEQLGIKDRLHLLGFRRDVDEIYKAADICAFPSQREGLGLAAIEGMAAGLPLIASEIRGVNDYAANGDNAFLCTPTDVEGFRKAIECLVADKELRKSMGNKNAEIAKSYDKSVIMPLMKDIYLGK